MKASKFLKIFISIFLVFLAFHSFVWYFYTSNIFGRKDNLYIGDLARVSYQVDALHPRKLEYTLEKKHLNAHNYNTKQLDILSVGDSFSNADTGGLNPYYQDYIATIYNQNILNLKRNSEELNSLELLIGLYNNGWLEKHKPKYIILQMVERFAIETHAKDFNWNFVLDKDKEIIADYKTKDSYIPELNFINTANYKFILYSLKYNFTKKGHKYYPKLQLKKNFFSSKTYSNSLLISYEDIKYASTSDDSRIKKLNSNLNKLAKLLKSLDIKLIYMPAVDKYDLYYDFIDNNPFAKNYFFNLLEQEHKNYIFINTKEILLKSLRNGEVDIFYADDTHWSYKASEKLISDESFQRIFKNE